MAVSRTPHVLVVAGSDSSGGAGIVRDIETLAAFDVKASVAITAVTVQTHHSVLTIDAVSPERVAAQMRAALGANRAGAIKIGMLATAATLAAVASVIADHPDIPVVLDPVLASTSGRALIASDAKTEMDRLFRLCTLITPNLPELSRLTDAYAAVAATDAIDRARLLLAAGARAILVKGGHADGIESVDILVQKGLPVQHFGAPRLAGSMRGTGCMLASAIAAGLASGQDLPMAVRAAKAFVHRTIGDGHH